MNYTEAREQILTGDLIAVKSRAGPLAHLTIATTGTPYTHTGIAIWIEWGLFLAEINSGRNHLIPMSQLEFAEFDVFEPPIADRKAIRKQILIGLRRKVNYGFWNLIVIGLYRLFRIKRLPKSVEDKVCSEYSADTYIKAGWIQEEGMIDPGSLVEKLKFKFSVSNKGK